MSTAPTFDVLIAEEGDGYTAQVQAAYGVGELPPQPFQPPFVLGDLAQRRGDVAGWVDQARVVRRSAGSEEMALAKALGAALFEQLFRGELLAGLRESRKALPLNDYLRVRLRLPASLATLPWELLFDPREDQFLVLAPDLVLVRYPEIPTPVMPLHLDGPLQVVVVAASPRDLPPLDTEQEFQRIAAALQGPVARGQIKLDLIRGPDTLAQLRTRLREAAHVVHFLGHGDVDSSSGEGFLLFEDAGGAAEVVNAELLRVHLQKQRGQTQLVVLNACLGALPGSSDPFSSVGAALLRVGVPAVLAMQFAIPDEVAVELARVFYAELAAGAPVELAVNETRMQLYGRNPFRLDWVIPVLFLRATDGLLFERAAETAAVPVSAPSATATPPAVTAPASAAAPAPAGLAKHQGPLLAGLLLLLMLAALGLLLRNAFTPEAVQQLPVATLAADTGAAAPVADDIAAVSTTGAETAAGATSAGGAALPAPSFPTPAATLPPLPALNISNTPGRSEQAQVAVDAAGAVHVVWQDNTPRQGQGETLLYRRLTPDGTWSDVLDLTPELEYVGRPYLVSNLAHELCLVDDSVLGVFSRCLNNGEWSSLEELVQMGTRNVFAPALDAARQPHWLWGLNDLRYGDVQIDDGLAGVADAQLAIDAQGHYHAVWNRAGAVYSLEYRFSDAAGASWQPQQRLTAADAEFVRYPAFVADAAGALHLVWMEDTGLRYRRWTPDRGWEDEVVIGERGVWPAVAVGEQQRPAVAWLKDCQVLFAQQQPDESWPAARVLNADASPSACASDVDLDVGANGQVHVIWVAPGNDGERDVYHAALEADQ